VSWRALAGNLRPVGFSLLSSAIHFLRREANNAFAKKIRELLMACCLR
jgi:hypothetical protein